MKKNVLRTQISSCLKHQLFTSRTVAANVSINVFIMNAVVVLIILAGAHGIEQRKASGRRYDGFHDI
jgi:hypothetical protein